MKGLKLPLLRQRLWSPERRSQPAMLRAGPPWATAFRTGLYGNEPNIVGPFAPGGPAEQEPGTKGGRVVPSQSPGPFVNAGPNEPPRNDRVRGPSVGALNQQFGGGAVPAFCRADPTALD